MPVRTPGNITAYHTNDQRKYTDPLFAWLPFRWPRGPRNRVDVQEGSLLLADSCGRLGLPGRRRAPVATAFAFKRSASFGPFAALFPGAGLSCSPPKTGLVFDPLPIAPEGLAEKPLDVGLKLLPTPFRCVLIHDGFLHSGREAIRGCERRPC